MRYVSLAIDEGKADKLQAKLAAKNASAVKSYEAACEKAEAEGTDAPNKPVPMEFETYVRSIVEAAA